MSGGSSFPIKDPTKFWIAKCLKQARLRDYDISPLGDTKRILEPICVDIAASTQKLFEETILYASECVSEMFINSNLNIDTLCYAGGTGLNCPTNSRLFKESPFRNIYIPPNCDDSGLSLGGAQYTYHHLLNNLSY